MRTLLGILLALVLILAGAVYIFSDPDIARETLEAKYTNEASQFAMLADGTRMHYRDEGPRDAPVIVLVHGSNASLHTWEPWVSILKDRFRVVSLDLPAHGLTGATPKGDYSTAAMAQSVRDLADQLGIGQFAIAGNSMGGAVSAKFAETHPGRLTHLILIDSGGLPFEAGEGTPIGFRIARMPVVNNLLLWITPRSFFVEGLGKAIEKKEILTDAMIDRYWELARMEGSRGANRARFALAWDSEIADHLGEIDVPTLILWGKEDRLVPVSVAYEFEKRIPGSELIVYDGVGHIPMEEVPERSAATVARVVLAEPVETVEVDATADEPEPEAEAEP